MGASKQTPNLRLPLWQSTDRIEMTDFNQAMTTIDSALNARPTKLFEVGTTPPKDKRIFWIDSTPITGGIKAYINGQWTHVATAFTK